jgi:hypothetical protein
MAAPTSMSKYSYRYSCCTYKYRISTMVRAQMLSELEEIIAYKQYADQPERQQTMRKTWMKRYVTSLGQFLQH